jgi:group I intron endonuclease
MNKTEICKHREYNPKYYPDSEINGVCGIYQIRNTLNGDFYIGSAFDLLDRRGQHFCKLRGNKHFNNHLQNAYNLYGKENFVYEVVEFCEPEVKYEVEQYWLDQFFGKEFCYNLNPRASHPPVQKGKDNPISQSIICLDDKNTFDTIVDCCNYYKKDRTSINKNVNGQYVNPEMRFTYLNIYEMMVQDGYTDEEIYQDYNEIIKSYSKYIKHVTQKSPQYGKDNPRARAIICLDDMKTFDTIKDCANFYSKDRTGIKKNINGKYIKPEQRFTYVSIYNLMIQDGYDNQFIYDNYNTLIKKYEHLIERLPNRNPLNGKNNAKSRKIICLDDLKVFDTIADCCDCYSKERSSIAKNIRGVYVNPDKKFTYLKVYNLMIEDGYDNDYIYQNYNTLIKKYDKHLIKQGSKYGKNRGENSKAKKIICLNDEKIFDCMKDCSEYYNINYDGIRKTCKGKSKSSKFKLMFLDTYNKMINDGYNMKYIIENYSDLLDKYNNVDKDNNIDRDNNLDKIK